MTQELRVWTACLTLSAIGLAQACATSKPAKSSNPQCTDQQLAKIEAAYVAEASQACAGKTFDDCPALPAIRKKYDGLELDYVGCE